MDPVVSPLTGLLDALAESERFRAFVDGFPANARVSEPALPLVLATLHRELARPLVCLLAEDEEARDVAEAVGWYADADRVALLGRDRERPTILAACAGLLRLGLRRALP